MQLLKRIAFIHNLTACMAAFLLLAPLPAHAQFSDSYKFLKAVREKDGATAMELLNKGGNLINTRDASTGDTPLLIATRERSLEWMSFLLGKGANPNSANGNDVTPLLVAAQLGFVEGAQLLIGQGAVVDRPGANGETPLIRAVLLRNIPMTRLLVAQGANPDRADMTGMSARAYVKRDAPDSVLASIIADAKPKSASDRPVQGPVF